MADDIPHTKLAVIMTFFVLASSDVGRIGQKASQLS
jgi:hypothetical protein